jgi:hypothetical protein
LFGFGFGGWVRFFGFVFFGFFGAPGFSGSWVDPFDDDFGWFGELGVVAAAVFEGFQGAEVGAFESFDGAAEVVEEGDGVVGEVGVIEGAAFDLEEVVVAHAVEGELAEQVGFDGVGGAVVLVVGLEDLVVVQLDVEGEGVEGFGPESGFEGVTGGGLFAFFGGGAVWSGLR